MDADLTRFEPFSKWNKTIRTPPVKWKNVQASGSEDH